MDLLRTRSTALWALAIAVSATALLPLSHLGMDHAEDCPLCHLGSHSFEPATVAIEPADDPDPRQGWILPADASLPDARPHGRPPGRAPPFLRAA